MPPIMLALRTLPLSFWLLFVAAGGHTAGLFGLWAPPSAAPALLDHLSNAISVAMALIVAVRARTARAHRSVLAPLTAAFLTYALAECLWTSLDVYTTIDPFPSIADVFYLLMYPLLGAAFLRLPAARLHRLDTLRVLLDSLIVTSVAGVFTWYFVLGPTLLDVTQPWLNRAVSLAYPALDLALLNVLLLPVFRGKRLRAPELLFAAGVAGNIVADLLFTFHSAHGQYTAGRPLDALWTWSMAALALAGACLARTPAVAAPTPATGPVAGVVPVLPLLAVAAVCVLLLRTSGTSGPVADGVPWGTVLVVLLVMVRQTVGFAHNARLTADLQRYTRALQASRAELAHRAHHDALTNLANRALYEDRLQRALQRAERAGHALAVLYLDLDGFKGVNDRLGHAAGDALLVAAARRLEAAVRRGDTVARLGGDEFTVLMPTVPDAATADTQARRIVQALAQPYTLDGHDVTVTASVGIGLYPLDATDGAQLQRCADLAMYRAKASGKNQVGFSAPTLDGAARERLRLERELRAALEQAAFTLHYQPLLDTRTGRITGAEALLRWPHAERGQVPPDVFLPVAEATGLIVPLGAWVVREACRQAAAWRQAGHALRVAVHVSARQLQDASFADEVVRALHDAPLDGAALELELNERLLLTPSPQVTANLTRLRQAGVRVAIDDFGQGPAALTTLMDLPAQILKIDRGFTQRLGRSSEAQRRVRAVTTLGQALGMEVVAEGVETPQQWATLRALGVDRAQGALLGHPMTAPHLTLALQREGAHGVTVADLQAPHR